MFVETDKTELLVSTSLSNAIGPLPKHCQRRGQTTIVHRILLVILSWYCRPLGRCITTSFVSLEPLSEQQQNVTPRLDQPTPSLRTQWTSHGSDARIPRAVPQSRKAPQSTLARTLTRAHTHTHTHTRTGNHTGTHARTHTHKHYWIAHLPICVLTYRSAKQRQPRDANTFSNNPLATSQTQAYFVVSLSHPLTSSCLSVTPIPENA